MTKRPPKCKDLAIINPKDEIMREYEAEWGQEGSVERNVAIYKATVEAIQHEESNRMMMEKRATIAEIILALVILSILTCSILVYAKLYKKEQMDEAMIE